MQKRPSYGQYCPLSMAAEILGTRWTLLLLRELLEGSTQFNDIARGVPLMSRSMLSQRLKDLEQAGLVTKDAGGRGKPTHYRLTEAGQSSVQSSAALLNGARNGSIRNLRSKTSTPIS